MGSTWPLSWSIILCFLLQFVGLVAIYFLLRFNPMCDPVCHLFSSASLVLLVNVLNLVFKIVFLTRRAFFIVVE